MVLNTLKRLTSGPKPVIIAGMLLLASLYLMSAATRNSALFGQLYSLLLVINILAAILLLALILRQLFRLIQQYRQQVAGSRLTTRLVIMFLVLALTPASVVYYFSLEFLHRNIDSWFDVRVEQALEDSLALGRTSLEDQLRTSLQKTRTLATELTDTPDGAIAIKLNELRQRGRAAELILLNVHGRVIASSSVDQTQIVPSLPNQALLQQIRQGLDYARLEPVDDQHLQLRIAVPIPLPSGEDRLLHAIYPIAERLSKLANSVQYSFSQYKELAFLQNPLKQSFSLTLSLVLMLSLLTAVWAAFSAAHRLMRPISDLAEGTRAVAAGDYDKRLPLPGRDELGFLVRSFNEMTRKISLSRDQAEYSQHQLEAQHAYLETVLGRLSSGVITIDTHGILHTANAAAGHILEFMPEQAIGKTLSELAEQYASLEPFSTAIEQSLLGESSEWRAEVSLSGASGRQILMCRASRLPGEDPVPGGQVIVFDDITALVQAQRDAAWGEVARRLAHEIKNPLTPIQLSAERLRHKYLDKMNSEDAKVLDSATHTIVQQVEAMKEMVNSFAEYARSPSMNNASLNMNALVREVVELYRNSVRQLQVNLELDDNLPMIEADDVYLRQLLHNLIKNSLEAGDKKETVSLTITTRTRTRHKEGNQFIELQLEDNGPGFPEDILEKIFDPYVTTKTKGTGLGMSIVKKIIEEHGGELWVQNTPGAQVTIQLPLKETPRGKEDATPGGHKVSLKSKTA